MELSAIIAALVAVLFLTFWVRVKRLRRNVANVTEKFREHGAIKEKRARTLTDLGLRSKAKYPFLIRDEQVEALTQLLRQGIVCQASQDDDSQEIRFYLDEQKCPDSHTC